MKKEIPGISPAKNCSNHFTISELLQEGFSYFRNVEDITPRCNVSLMSIHECIKKHKALCERMNYLRSLISEEYNLKKGKGPCVTFSGLFRTRSKQQLIKSTHWIVIDIDKIDDANRLQQLKLTLQADPHLLMMFLSPSGKGLKCLFIAEFFDDNSYKSAFKHISTYLENRYAITVDTSGKDITRLCLLSADPEVFLNLNAIPFERQPEPAEPELEKEISDEPEKCSVIVNGRYVENYTLRVLREALENIINAPPGHGNDTLNISAMKAGTLFHYDLFDREAVQKLFSEAYIARQGSPKTQEEANRTFTSGWKYGLTKPRVIGGTSNDE